MHGSQRYVNSSPKIPSSSVLGMLIQRTFAGHASFDRIPSCIVRQLRLQQQGEPGSPRLPDVGLVQVAVLGSAAAGA